MEKFKTVFLSVLKKIVDFISIIALILTVLSGAVSIFYNELNQLFSIIGIPQERLVWLTITLGGLGTSGVILTRVSGGLKQAVLIAKSTQEVSQKSFEKEMTAKLSLMEKFYESKINSIESSALAEIKELTKENLDIKNELRKINTFNFIQAKKYLEAPDRVIDKELKEKYHEFIETNKR